MREFWCGCVVAALLCVVGGTALGGPMDLVKVGELRGEVFSNLLVSDGYAYCVGPEGLSVYDVSDPSQPTLVGNCGDPTQGPFYASGITRLEGYLYVSCHAQDATLVVFDVSDPSHPAHADSFWPGEIGKLYVHGQHGYAAASGSMAVFDLSDPGHPTVVNWYQDDSIQASSQVVFSGEYAFVACTGGDLLVLDLSDPAEPAPVTRASISPGVDEAVASGDYLYLAAGHETPNLHILDISDPTAPVEVASPEDPLWRVDGLVISGDRAFLAERNDIYARLRVMDVSDPSAPGEIASCATAHALQMLSVESDFLFAGGWFAGFRVFDISGVTPVSLVTPFINPGFVTSMEAVGDTAYVTDVDTVYAVDISDPEAPQVAGTHPSLWWHELGAVTTDGYVYCLGPRGTILLPDYLGLRILDFSSPTHPVEAAVVYPGLPIGPIAVSGARAYAVDQENSCLRILDVSDPYDPQEAGTFDMSGWQQYTLEQDLIAACGDYVYLLNRGSLHVIDCTSPSSPVDRVATGSYLGVWSWSQSGDRIYVALWNLGLGIVDISEPSAPVLYGPFPIDEPTPGAGGKGIAAATASGSYAYLTTSEWSLETVDVSDPSAPVVVGYYALPLVTSQIASASGREVALSRNEWGLVILQNPVPFVDLPSSFWALDYIAACSEAGLVGGYADGSYRPDLVVTRDAIAVYISRGLAGGDELVPSGPATATFSDVPTDHWAYRYVEYAFAEGVVGGYGDHTYRPTLTVDRAGMTVFVSRAMAGGDGGVPDDPDATPYFPDVPNTHWAYRYVEYCHDHGVVGGYGDGTYRPAGLVNRAQMAVFIARGFGLPM